MIKKYLILLSCLIILLAGCGSPCGEFTTKSIGKVISVQYLNGGYGNPPRTIVSAEQMIVVIDRIVPTTVGDEGLIVTDECGRKNFTMRNLNYMYRIEE